MKKIEYKPPYRARFAWLRDVPSDQVETKLAELRARAREMNDSTQFRERPVRNQARRDRDQAMRDIGMTKVRGNLGGTYWE
jgi:hypothetical protein